MSVEVPVERWDAAISLLDTASRDRLGVLAPLTDAAGAVLDGPP